MSRKRDFNGLGRLRNILLGTCFALLLQISAISYVKLKDTDVVVIIPRLPRDGGTARTAIQVHAVNLIENWLGERWQTISNQS